MKEKQFKIYDVKENKNGKTLILEDTNGSIYEKLVSLKTYNQENQTWNDDAEQEVRTKEACKQYLNEAYETLENCMGNDIQLWEDSGRVYFEYFIKTEKVTNELPKTFKATIVELNVDKFGIVPVVEYNGKNYKIGGFNHYFMGHDKKKRTLAPKLVTSRIKFLNLIKYDCHYEEVEEHIEQIKEIVLNREITVVRETSGANLWLSSELND